MEPESAELWSRAIAVQAGQQRYLVVGISAISADSSAYSLRDSIVTGSADSFNPNPQGFDSMSIRYVGAVKCRPKRESVGGVGNFTRWLQMVDQP